MSSRSMCPSAKRHRVFPPCRGSGLGRVHASPCETHSCPKISQLLLNLEPVLSAAEATITFRLGEPMLVTGVPPGESGRMIASLAPKKPHKCCWPALTIGS